MLIEEDAQRLYDEAPCGYLYTHPDGTLLRVNDTMNWKTDGTPKNTKLVFAHENPALGLIWDLVPAGDRLYFPYEKGFWSTDGTTKGTVRLADDPIGPDDRVLAGLSVAFDASCEEMWLAWRHGACLVPAPRALVRTGFDLGPWLVEREVTVVSTVPTLAALWPVWLAGLVLVAVSAGASRRRP